MGTTQLADRLFNPMEKFSKVSTLYRLQLAQSHVTSTATKSPLTMRIHGTHAQQKASRSLQILDNSCSVFWAS